MNYAVRIVGCIMVSVCTNSWLHAAETELKQKKDHIEANDIALLREQVKQLTDQLETLTKKHLTLAQIVMMNCADLNRQGQCQVYVPVVYQTHIPLSLPDNQQPNSQHNAALYAKQSAQFNYQSQGYLTSYKYAKTPVPVLTQPEQL